MRQLADVWFVVLLGLLAGHCLGEAPTYAPLAAEDVPLRVGPIPDALREEFRINLFYKKCVVIRGIPVIGAEEVTDYAFLECAWTLDHMLHERSMVLDALVKAKVRVGIIGTGFGARVVAPTYEAAGAVVADVVSARDDAAVAGL